LSLGSDKFYFRNISTYVRSLWNKYVNTYSAKNVNGMLPNFCISINTLAFPKQINLLPFPVSQILAFVYKYLLLADSAGEISCTELIITI